MTKVVSEHALLVVPEDPKKERFSVAAGEPFDWPGDDAEWDSDDHHYVWAASSKEGRDIVKRVKGLEDAPDAPDVPAVETPEEGA